MLAVLAALLGSGFGLGDVTLAGLVGLATGYVGVTATLIASFAAFLLAGVYGVARIVVRRGTRKDDIAFGPWMLVGTLIALLVDSPPAALRPAGPASRVPGGAGRRHGCVGGSRNVALVDGR